MSKLCFIFAGLAFLLFFSGCKKEKVPEPDENLQPTYPDYSQLEAGNYWIYQRFNIDSNGIYTPTNNYDSCYIEKDTIINGQTYFKYLDPIFSNIRISFIRDSLHYIVNSDGIILFSSQDYTNILDTDFSIINNDSIIYNDTICRVTTKMEDNGLLVITPADTFVTKNAQKTYFMYPGWDTVGNIRYRNRRYAEGIGIVTETLPFFVHSPNYTERQLVRFHVN